MSSSPPKHANNGKSGRRASAACAACRHRRIKCVVVPEQQKCASCLRHAYECAFDDNDLRKRRTSRTYVDSLKERIELLEKKVTIPEEKPSPAAGAQLVNEPMPYKVNPSAEVVQSNRGDSAKHNGPTMSAYQQPVNDTSESSTNSDENDIALSDRPSPNPLSADQDTGLVHKLLSSSGHMAFDQSSGRHRYFGPTTTFHIYSDLHLDKAPRAARKAIQRTQKLMNSLSPQTYEYLLDLFWQFYNSGLHVVHKDAFCADMANGRTQYYSDMLHICILAIGYRFADRNRPDIQRLALPNRESTLHRAAKRMFEYELERPGGISSIQALLLLCDLECAVGRDNTGWVYGGMACRLCFDIGLYLDSNTSNLSELDVQIRHMVLWACVVYDQYWALFLGRPTSIKSSDLAISTLTDQFARLSSCRPLGSEEALVTLIYEALLDLMDIASKITENLEHTPAFTERNAYLKMIMIDRDLTAWYTRLPESIRWTTKNVSTAPYSFFILHQQYHAALILLHQRFAHYEKVAPGSDGGEAAPMNELDHFSRFARTISFENAHRVARIFEYIQERFDVSQIAMTGMQHAGAAATALVAELTLLKDPKKRKAPLRYLHVLAESLFLMSANYAQAEMMWNVLNDVMRESGWELPRSAQTRSAMPARTASMDNGFFEAPAKRRRVVTFEKPSGSPENEESGRSESFSSVGQRNGFGLASMGPLPLNTDNLFWPTIDNPSEPTFIDKDYETLIRQFDGDNHCVDGGFSDLHDFYMGAGENELHKDVYQSHTYTGMQGDSSDVSGNILGQLEHLH